MLMKVALVHDYLNQYGGAERVLQNLLEIFPEADVYTLIYDKKLTYGIFSEEIIKGTSFLDYGFVARHHYWFIPLMPLAAESINLGEKYDLIISDTWGYAKGINYKRGVHISYCHTPLRYAWDTDSHLKTRLNDSFYKIIRPVTNRLVSYLRNWDKKTAAKPDLFFANSEFIAAKMRKYYEREPDGVIYPPVDEKMFFNIVPYKKRSYYLAAGRLVHYKRFDIVVEAFNQLKLPLKIVGRGPELEYLKKINESPFSSFISAPMTDEEMSDIYNNAKALIFPQVEDFGLVAAEAVACGTPVVAYNEGGAKEIVEEGLSGFFINEQTKEAVVEGVEKITEINFNSEIISEMARKFSKERFAEKIKEAAGQGLSYGL